MMNSPDVCDEFRDLAARLATADPLDPADLERLAELALAAAEAVRHDATERSANLFARLTESFRAFSFPGENCSLDGVAVSEDDAQYLEQLARTVRVERERLDATDRAIDEAHQAGDYAALARHASVADTAKRAVENAEQHARECWHRICFRNGTTPLAYATELRPAAPEDGGTRVRDPTRPGAVKPDAKEVDLPVPSFTPATDQLPEPETEPALAVAGTAGEPTPAIVTEVDDDSPAAEPPRTSAVTESDLGPLWQALRSERLGLAEALVETASHGSPATLLLAAIGLAAMALVADGTGSVDDQAREKARQALEAWQSVPLPEEAALPALVLLLPAAATLALLAPGSDQAGLIEALIHPPQATECINPWQIIPALCRVAKEVEDAAATFGATLHAGSEMLAALVTNEQWQEERVRYAGDLQIWLETQSSRRIRYAAATDVWHQMLRADGALGCLLRIAVQNVTSRQQDVRSFVEHPDLDGLIRTTEAQVRGNSASRRSPIQGPALRDLRVGSEEAVQRLRGWLTLLDRAPSTISSDRAKPIARLRTRLRLHIAEAREKMNSLSEPAAAAVPAGSRMLDRLENLFEGRAPSPLASSADELVGRDLLPVPAIRFGASWTRERPLPCSLREELEHLAAVPAPSFTDAVRGRIREGDFVGAELALAYATEADDHAPIERELQTAVEAAKKAGTDQLERVRSDVEKAEREGRLETGRAQELTERVVRLHGLLIAQAPIADASAAIADSRNEITRARNALDSAAEAVRQRIALRLDRLGVELAEDRRARISALLQDGQFALAEDLVERLEDRETLEPGPRPPVEQHFDAFFPGRAEVLAGWLRGKPALMRKLGDKSLQPPLDLLPAGLSTCPQDLSLVAEAWANCVGARGNHLRDALKRLLAALGFTDPDLPRFAAPGKDVSEAVFHFEARPLRDRATSILPEFGSVANGSYNLLCLWGKRDAEDISQALARHPVGGGATIVLFFAVLDPEQRRRLASLARAARVSSAIVLDEVLALHLGMLEAGRLPAFFACALPFTDSRPWSDTGTPPPEMFFGRQRELRAVEARAGDLTHLIYGGRQLGKTALLRQVERAAAPLNGTIARYIGIAQIGATMPPDELWQLLAEELGHAGVPIPSGATKEHPGILQRAIRGWLNEKSERRIIVLLDEADEFFAKDRANRFAVTEALRTLAMDTDRRFKPVFAGLKNVQKLARDPNSPLAHLGTPLVIGPLIRGQERKDAEELVRWPFEALGYRLDDAAVSRILAFANYYPSLIQLICQQLLRNLRARQGGGGPPWPVGIDDMKDVLDRQDLRDAAFEKFHVTLELDQRYNLMTLIAAEFSINDPELLARGIDKSLLRDFAAEAWPAGFSPGFGEDAFEALLDEMVGLGLLRRVEGTQYALRSANLAHLIGSPIEIGRQIEKFQSRPAPAESDPLETRRNVNGRPSLLTARQEGYLLGAGAGITLILAGL
ncbi:MAG: hypothetical protein ACREE5_12145, partial [Acetobacteraceae bacterium]